MSVMTKQDIVMGSIFTADGQHNSFGYLKCLAILEGTEHDKDEY